MFKINNLTTLTLLLLSIFVLVSCEKDSPATPSKSKNETLVIGSWKLDSSIAPGYKDYKLPEGTLTLSLFSSGNYNMLINSKVIEKYGTWKLLTNESEIQFKNVLSSRDFVQSIISVNDKNLILQYTDGGYLFTDYYTKTNYPIP